MNSIHSRIVYGFLVGIILFYGFGSSEKAPDYSFVHQATMAPTISYHNYIIIGGGTAGCPLAATLSKLGGVLLLERGGSPYGNPNITDITAFGAALADLSPDSPSQFFASEEGVINARGRVLGGSSAINAGFYSRAEPEFVSQVGWDPKLVDDSFKWVEKKVAFLRTVRRWQAAVTAGLLEIGVVPYNGATYDHLIGTKESGSIFDDNGKRHTTADLLEYADPKGLNVLLHASVQKILFETHGKSKKLKAYGVVFKDASGRIHTAYLKKGSKNEIILSAGALGSPQILMLSGIGPKKQLQDHGIRVVMDQPLVGQNMADNPMNPIFIPSPVSVETALIQTVGITSFGSYIEPGCGINLGAPANYRTLLGLPPAPIPDQNAPKPKNPLEVSSFFGGFFLEKVKGPLSRGQIELRNVDPNDNPKVTFNYFKDPKDLEICVGGIEKLKELYNSKSFSQFRYDFLPIERLLDFTANKNITSTEEYCRSTVSTIWHYHGGCQVGSVVDHDYKVLGVDSLRVIDGSTFDISPGTNPQATVMMLGRYMGVKILKERYSS